MLCDPHMGGGIKYCDWTGHFGDVVSVCFDIWVLRSKIAINCTVHTGHVVSAVCSICG